MFSWCPASSLISTVFVSPLLRGLPDLWGEERNGDLKSRLFPQNVWLWVFASAPIFCWRKHPVGDWTKYQFRSNSRVSLGIISSLFFCQACLILPYVSVCQSLGSWPTRQCQEWNPSHDEGLELKQTLVDHSHTFCTIITLEHFSGG